MLVTDAKDVARRWVRDEGMQLPGFAGAFFHGSINWLGDNATIAATSDVDVMLVLAGPEPARKPGKLIYHDVMLEVSFVQQEDLRSPSLVLSQSHMAGSFRGASIIADPSGQLSTLQQAVSADYAKRRWVRRRCEHVVEKIENNLRGLDAGAPFHDSVAAWLFATGLTTHVPLVAGLKNPTVRRRYEAVRDLLAEYGYDEFYVSLLQLLGCATMDRPRVAHHMVALAEVFDVASEVIKSPFFFAADISASARAVPIDGSWGLIERGDHREAIFWIVATYARCLKVLAHDAPELLEVYTPGFRQLVGDLGITSFADMQQRGEELKAFLPRLREVAEAIMVANPEIEDEPESTVS